MISIIPLVLSLVPGKNTKNNGLSNLINEIKTEFDPQISLPALSYDWWNKSWEFRVPVEIKAIGNQQDAPVEFFINFTAFFEDLNVGNPELNVSSIRVIEYASSSTYYEIESQFDPYSRSYDSQTNAIGDIIWILNGTTSNNQIRDFYIYFNNGSIPSVPDPNYDTIRLWHEGFEEYRTGDILRPTDGQDNYHPTYWEISNTTSARGSSSLRMWGNGWKASATGTINIDPDTIVTAKMRFDDPTIAREISGIGFRTGYTAIPASGNSYNIRGYQNWGSAGSYKFRNQYYSANTFYWYTLNLDSEIGLSSFDHIFYVADDDSWTNLNLYWDDISIWAKTVQTTPNNSLQTTLGDIQPLSFTMKITCKDEDSNTVSDAHLFLTNDLNPSYNQDHETDENGQWTFTDLEKDAFYNITINYTQNGLSNPKTATVQYYENYQIIELNSVINAFINLTTIEFNITDKDGDPIQYGYVLLKDGASADVGKGIISDSGETTLSWINNTNYNYNVYFDFDILPDTAVYRYNQLEIADGSVNIGIHDVNITTEIAKVNFNVTQFSDGSPFVGAKLRFFNRTDFDNESKILANVTVQSDGSARFFSFSNESAGNWGNYTLDVYFGGDLRNFYADAMLININEGFNFTLNQEFSVNISIDLNMAAYNSSINFIDISDNIFWGEQVTFEFNFTKRDPLVPPATLVTPTELNFRILDEEQLPFSEKVSIISSEISTGVFSYQFNTTQLSLNGGNRYWIEISGNYKSYVSPDDLLKRFEVQALPAGIKYYNYSLSELTDKKISVIFSESVNITVDYFEIGTGSSLNGALISYNWDFGSGTLGSDPMHTDLYYFEFDSSPAPTAAEYIIDVLAVLSNYTIIADTMIIKILPRPTTVNGTTSLFQISPKVYVLDSVEYIFEYEDFLSTTVIGDLDVAGYNWYRLDENGDPLTGLGNEGSGDLTQSVNNLYILDFDTELREVGEYSIFITLQKSNYEVRNAFVSLTISKRPISVDLAATGLTGKQINVVQGDNINIRITLYDPTNGSQLLTNANITLNLGDNQFTFGEVSAGVYEYDYSTSNINAFFNSMTLTGEITIEKENYEVDPLNIAIIVGMTEIFPGFPLFYFILVVGGIVAVVGSLVTYRVIQQARIPTFVKKARKMKKVIKSKKTISDSLLYPSKDEYIVKQLGDKWDMLGLSLNKILGIDGKKKKPLPETPGEFKDLKGGGV
jgi:hypothetical protein